MSSASLAVHPEIVPFFFLLLPASVLPVGSSLRAQQECPPLFPAQHRLPLLRLSLHRPLPLIAGTLPSTDLVHCAAAGTHTRHRSPPPRQWCPRQVAVRRRAAYATSPPPLPRRALPPPQHQLTVTGRLAAPPLHAAPPATVAVAAGATAATVGMRPPTSPAAAPALVRGGCGRRAGRRGRRRRPPRRRSRGCGRCQRRR